ncbi:sporulation protein [Enhygromyxa salina]|uniref:SpoOM protein n=1 Tax=Enhygromyxa salina TaxID=215803 RepID=A0A2S9YN99_9BACT|nr:sporulation protein [Enhygromyxa salina]PRQ06573.1 SpoOM protein [Enhygromyxa salina]
MGFSDKMRETLGSEGARLEFVQDPDGWTARVAPGGTAEATLRLAGGTKTARVEGVILRVFVRHRHWADAQGMELTEQQALELEDRNHLMPAWSREQLSQTRVEVEQDIEPGAQQELTVQVQVPEHCDATTRSCTITLHAQADIRGQIDPTVTGKLLVN